MPAHIPPHSQVFALAGAARDRGRACALPFRLGCRLRFRDGFGGRYARRTGPRRSQALGHGGAEAGRRSHQQPAVTPGRNAAEQRAHTRPNKPQPRRSRLRPPSARAQSARLARQQIGPRQPLLFGTPRAAHRSGQFQPRPDPAPGGAAIPESKVEGLSQDQRVFGSFGPGDPRDVLSQLLEGSGYNVLMLGGQGDGAPEEIVLSIAKPAGPQPPGNNSRAAKTIARSKNRPNRFRSRAPRGSPAASRPARAKHASAALAADAGAAARNAARAAGQYAA